eukprot:TRINITY_DN8386_c0_g1_i5.p1 TRINITY_DN8386_c0_g1~~TRINITY_DN8386_c0_g1_i5.p1  ORF type:complete len:221 (+),score=31.95 TRINITY_DN8386_c0_g1_i5:97-759(+)
MAYSNDNAKDLSGYDAGSSDVSLGSYGVLPADTGMFTVPAGVQSPYLNIGGIDASMLETAEPEFLYANAKNKGRSFGEMMFYTTGSSYLTGTVFGGAYGIVEGLRHPAATSNRLRLNTVLNAVQKRGPFLGNTLGIIALMYNISNWSISKVRGGTEDIGGHVTAATLTGLVYRAASGPRQAVLGAVTGLALSATFFVGKAFVNKDDDTSLFEAVQEKQYS